ncbi:hypothetical protein SUDANB1_00063 [Streptomyces sp. enrichment culture]
MGAVNLWHGADYDTADGAVSYDVPKCTTSGTTATCTMNFQVAADTRDMINVVANAHAGAWKIAAFAFGKDRARTAVSDYATTKVQRASKPTVNASPEPVKKGEDHSYRRAHPRELELPRLGRLQRPERQTAVPAQELKHLHDAQEPHPQQHRHAEHHRHRRRLLPLPLRRHLHHPRGHRPR